MGICDRYAYNITALVRCGLDFDTADAFLVANGEDF
jgi:hypothetical protein